MKKDDAFPKKYLTTSDLPSPRIEVIDAIEWEQIGKDDKEKPVLHFRGNRTKPLVLNATNWDLIVEATGQDDSDDWSGERIKLFVDPTVRDLNGKKVGGIRVAAAPKKAQPEPEPESTEDEDMLSQ